MRPQTPEERRGFHKPDWKPPNEQPSQRPQDRRRLTGWTMLASILMLLVVVWALVAVL